MRKLNIWAVLGAAVLGLFFALPAQVGSAQSIADKEAAAAGVDYVEAQIIPAESTAVGDGPLTGGSAGEKGGEALWANGVSDIWVTGDYTINFLVLVFSSHAETGNVEFRVVSPSKATVYRYSYPSEQLPQGEYWFNFAAKANYATPGLYFAEWYLGNKLDGWAPLTFNA